MNYLDYAQERILRALEAIAEEERKQTRRLNEAGERRTETLGVLSSLWK